MSTSTLCGDSAKRRLKNDIRQNKPLLQTAERDSGRINKSDERQHSMGQRATETQWQSSLKSPDPAPIFCPD
jgi:hypothetical protein